MPLTTTGRNAAASGFAAVASHIGALTDLGTTEVAGGSYARQPVTWNSPAAGVVDNNGAVNVPIPAGTTVVAASAHSALSAGSIQAWGQIGSTKRGVASVDTIANDTLQSDGHGLTNGNRVFVQPVAGEALPAGLSATVIYFVVGATADTFQISATLGGSAVDITGLNEFAWFHTVPETFANPGVLQIASGAFDVDFNGVA